MSFPLTGTIVVSKAGTTIVHVWPDEGSPQGCFTGISLLTGESSVMWDIAAFEHHNSAKPGLLSKYRAARKELGR